LTCGACNWVAKLECGVIDLLPPRPPARESFQRDMESCIRGIMASLGMPPSDSNKAAISSALAPVIPTGYPFFDAEEELFIDRFAIRNFESKLELGPLYLPTVAKIGSVFHCAVRVRNRGAFDLSSAGAQPVLLSYHWRKDGEIIEFEGIRSTLPIDLPPGRELTAVLEIRAPLKDGAYELQVLPLQEFVRWHDEAAVGERILIDSTGPNPRSDIANGEAFSENYDGRLGSEFVDQHVELARDGVVLEIGGGIRPSFRENRVGSKWEGIFINTDISMKLLRIARYLATQRGDNSSWQVRLDANAIPCHDNSVDAIFCSRVVHHFENLRHILGEIVRVLKHGGQLVLLCEPVGIAYDDFAKRLMMDGVNEQVFPRGIYERCASEAGLDLIVEQCDWGFSFKGLFRKR